MTPAIFIGHGSPMNALEENEYTRGWREIAAGIPRPRAILSVSAHWYTGHTGVCTRADPPVIHDFYGFPKELYQMDYPAPGAPDTAKKAVEILAGIAVEDNTWGLDHGTWSVLHAMYPDADIPVFQLSINKGAPPGVHYAIGRALRPLREEGVLIMGSGNIVHNLALAYYTAQGGFSWALEFDKYMDAAVRSRAIEDILHWERAGESAKYAFFTPDHYYPLLYALGAADDEYVSSAYNHSCTMGSISMTSYIFKKPKGRF